MTTLPKILPKEITSYDLLKTFAVIIMVVDHMGAYFFLDDLWWRAVGRIGFPVWFFLVGYSRGRDLPYKLIAGGLILIFANFVFGLEIFPLNALVTIGIIRVSIDYVMNLELRGTLWLRSVSFVLLMLIPLSYMFTEYGTLALITAVFGYLIRHRQEVDDEELIFRYMIFALIAFIVVQQISFGFDTGQLIFMAFGTAAVRMSLYYFEPKTFPEMTRKATKPLVWFLQFCGRRTLEIYVVHLLLFKALAFNWGIRGDGLFVFNLVASGG